MNNDHEWDRVYRNIDKAFQQFLSERAEIKRVEQIMDREVITIEDNASMFKAAKKMMDAKNIGTLIATRNKKVWGIVTERDLINVVADEKDLADIRIKDARSTPLITIQSKATIEEAAKIMIMSGGRLVVFEEGKLVGVVTPADIITSLPECPETLLKIDEFMTKDIVSIDESAPVIEAIKLMGEKKVGSVIVHRREKPQSIFTDGDFFLHYIIRGRNLSDPVKNAGSSPLKIISAGTSVHRTAYILSKEKVKRLPVVKNDKIIGIITARDLVKAYAQND